MTASDPERRRNLHPGWGAVVFLVVVWHGIHIATSLGPDYLFSMCYLANIILAAGIMMRSGLLIGVGFGWTLIALPLWAFDSWLTGQVMLSSVAFHITGVGVGLLALRHTLLSHRLVLAGIPTGLLSFLLARAFTHPQYNINAAFHVQEGWEFLFRDVRVYVLVQLAVYVLVFLLVPVVSNRFVYSGEKT